MIKYFNEQEVDKYEEYNNKFAWIERFTDYIVIIKEILKGKFFVKEIIRSYKMKKVYAVWSSKDKKPFFMYILLLPLLYFKRQ
jgi:hypothetical protein